ncbi:MAG: CoA transferase [Brevundimonas sp.]|uniref:CaiB/BaiF CoA transferase family protein n=1 Tax=Brevundimonas sp. TaxID=1871086 RepID=UPI00271C19BF|nr:CoA transferase [Brevundimonas sp.]MDO9077772.1 CoA transferase [Brevundimonas sp.]
MTEARPVSSPALRHRDYDPGAGGPLDGVRVLDLSRLFAGNVLTQMLGDFGAEVVKVEPPNGDTLRGWKTRGVSTHWKIYARNKKSLCLDLRSTKARELLLDLVPSAGIVVESFRPGVLEAMGLAPEILLKRNPKLVIVRISGWGQDGPYYQRPGFGTVIEGMSGFASINGFEDREPILPPMYLADGVAGVYGVSAALLALREAERPEGRGQVIDLPLYDPLFALLGPQAANFRLTGETRKATGSRSSNSAPRNAYRCRDGTYVSLSGSTQALAERIFNAIGRPDLILDPRFRTNADRLNNVAALDEVIGSFIAGFDQTDLVALMEKAEVTVGPIYDIGQIMVDPHVVEREILADYPDADIGSLPMHHVVPRMSETPGSIRYPAPRLGEHNRALLGELGIGDADYARLVDARVAIEDRAPDAGAES